jgi:3-deoxy-D-arabino-heptulosonate 7-phosphate (DAHP) synthase
VGVSELKVEQHPDKTFIGRIERGFDFLGYVMKPAGLEMAPRAIEHCVERVSRLDEQGADLVRFGAYLKRWSSWAKSGLSLDGGQFVDRAMEAISQRVAELATPHWPLPPT